MLVPLSWLNDFVDVDIPAELLAEKLTAAGLEVGHIDYIGLPQTQVAGIQQPKSDHLVWDRERLLLGKIREVLPHPNADRLVLAQVEIGDGVVEQCVTGAPNLFEYKETGELNPPLWTAFAAEGAEVWDGHSDTPKRMILKEKPLRGIPNRSMVCSEKELGISDEHEGIILLHEPPRRHNGQPFAPGTPLADVLGDIIFDIELTPNLARALSIYGVAREVAALLDKSLHVPSFDVLMEGAPFGNAATIEIQVPELNPRFTLALLRDTKIQPSPEWMQHRLRLVGQRPINNVVDVTNYITFEIGQPLHAFDYDKLRARVGDSTPNVHIITRLPEPGETLLTLDGQTRVLEDHNILVADNAGALSMGGIIGGGDTEISDETTNVLLEAAAWNFINIRRTMTTQKVRTEASYRFSRGVHPSQTLLGVRRGIELMRQTGGGDVAEDILDVYPLPSPVITVALHTAEIERLLGIAFTSDEAAVLLRRGGFAVEVEAQVLNVTVPDWRMDISADPVVGQADLIEEIARINGYEMIPTTIIADAMPPQYANLPFVREEALRDVLAGLGLHEIISYRFTTPEREALLTPPGGDDALPEGGYVTLLNPISPDKTVLRKSILTGLLEAGAANARYNERQALFEIGSIYLERDTPLPDEPKRLGILLTGQRQQASWTGASGGSTDFYDLKGIVEGILAGLHIEGARFERATHPSFHPGRSAALWVGDRNIGVFGELHPQVVAAFELEGVILCADFDLEALLAAVVEMYPTQPLPTTPPILQDIALVVRNEVTSAQVEATLRKGGGDLLKGVRLFDVYTGAPIPEGQKSLAYSLTYQTDDRTLTDKEVAKVQERIVRLAERELGATLRG